MMAYEQLSLFDLLYNRTPKWDDVQKGSAVHVRHKAYSIPCSDACMWHKEKFMLQGELSCYLFRKPVRNGMCPSTVSIERMG